MEKELSRNENDGFPDKLETLLLISKIIFELNRENITESSSFIIKKFDDEHPLSFNLIISQIIFSVLIARQKDFDIYIKFLEEIEQFEETKQIKNKIFEIFTKFLLFDGHTQDAYFLLNEMVEHNFIQKNVLLEHKKISYFVHYMTNEEIQQMIKYNQKFKYEIKKNILKKEKYRFIDKINEQYEELSKNDWELHKQLIREGVNPNKIGKIIRNDEIEKLQEISSQTNFDFKQTIKPSLYEKCSFINQKNVSLIDYAAFFGSVKCFKYLLMNGAKVENTGKYTIAGENKEIIHLCDQNNSTFEGVYETAIQFHRNDIFHYFYDNTLKEINNLEELGKLCILHHNYEIISFLLKEGMKINNDIINEAANIGNIFLVEYFLKEHSIPHDILVNSAISLNNELVEYMLKQEGIDINAKDIYLFYLIFILIY